MIKRSAAILLLITSVSILPRQKTDKPKLSVIWNEAIAAPAASATAFNRA